VSRQRLDQDEHAVLDDLQTRPGAGERIPIGQDMLGWLTALTRPKTGANGAAGGNAVPKKAPDTTGVSEETVSGTPFAKGGGDAHEVDINDVKQGGLGDCYFMAVLGAIARVRPEFIKNMIKDNKNGTYTVTFHTEQGISGLFGSRSNQQVTVDSSFWTDGKGNPTYANKTGDVDAANNPELWVMIIEKAWAKLHGGYGNITGGKVDDDAREAVTGKEATNLDPSDYNDADLTKKIEDHFVKNNLPVIFWSHKGEEGSKTEKKLTADGVVGNHEYPLNGVLGGKFTLYNPWGYKHLENVDAAFIKKHFQKVRLLKL
jgi:hypothetical protein